MMSRYEIAQELCHHLDGDGTANDSTTGELYCQYYDKNADLSDEGNLEIIESWAYEIYSKRSEYIA